MDSNIQDTSITLCRKAVGVIKAAILKSQARAAQSVNQEQLALYYGIGRFVSQNSRKGYWGKNAIGNISKMLKEELPGLKGFSEENIKLMRRFYESWENLEPNSVVGTTEMESNALNGETTNSVIANRQKEYIKDNIFTSYGNTERIIHNPQVAARHAPCPPRRR